MTGNWFESTNQAAGQFFGSIKGNRIDARIEGQTFAAFLNMTTHGNRQSISAPIAGKSSFEHRNGSYAPIAIIRYSLSS